MEAREDYKAKRAPLNGRVKPLFTGSLAKAVSRLGAETATAHCPPRVSGDDPVRPGAVEGVSSS